MSAAAQEDWVFGCTFDLGANFLGAHSHFLLQFEALDTVAGAFATAPAVLVARLGHRVLLPPATKSCLALTLCCADIELNGKLLGQAANANRPHIYDVSGRLLAGQNQLAVTLVSPLKAASQRAAAYPYSVPFSRVSDWAPFLRLGPGPSLRTGLPLLNLSSSPTPAFASSALQQRGAHGQYNFLRKPASDFGWDWGPGFAPSGIGGPVWLRGYSAPFLAGVAPAACCFFVKRIASSVLPGAQRLALWVAVQSQGTS